MGRSVAVVGAGAAGCATVHALGETSASVTVFERDGVVGGRARTRRQADCTYECGANYLVPENDRVAELIAEELPTEGLARVEDPVWTFDADGSIAEGDDRDEERIVYERGLDQLARRLLDGTDATVHRDVRVATLDRSDDHWTVYDGDGTDRGSFDAVVLTPPAPLTADLLGQAAWEHPHCRALRETIESVPLRAVVCGVLHYPVAVDRPYYALVDEGDGHDVGWVAREECKPGFVPDGESLLLVQMSPDWSAERFHDRPVEVVADVADRVADLLDEERLADPDWTDYCRWRYALPDEGIGKAVRETAAGHDLFLAGDWVRGRAHLDAALVSGLETGDRVAEHLTTGSPGS